MSRASIRCRQPPLFFSTDLGEIAVKNKVDLRFTLPERKSAPSISNVLSLLDGKVVNRQENFGQSTIEAWKRDAALGSPEAQYELAKSLTTGNPASSDNRAAVKWLRKAADKEHAASQHLLGVLIARAQGVRANPEQAVALFRAAAIMGNADAQYDLGRALTWGFGVEVNLNEALTWFRLAGAQGHLQAQLAVGLAYSHGQGCEPDLIQAASWLRKAALSHEAQAAFALGMLFLRPDNPQADNKDAYRWIGEAARAGLADAQYELALFFWSGRAVTRSSTQAFDWAMRAAGQDHIRALLFLSKLFETGDGCQVNRCGAYAVSLRAMNLAQNREDNTLGQECRLRTRELTALITTSELRAAEMLLSDNIRTKDLLSELIPGVRR